MTKTITITDLSEVRAADGGGGMSALEWLDAVRADLDAVSRFGRELEEAVTSREGRSVLAIADDLDDAHNALDGTAPDRLDRMERALRAVLELHRPIEVEPSDTICAACSNQLPNGRFLPVIEWPCPTVTTIEEALG